MECRCQPPAAAYADVDQLPSRQELVSRFGLFQCACTPEVAHTGVVSCGCVGCARWQAFLEGRLPGGPTWRQYEVWTRDYVTALAAYLRHRAEQLELERLVILEVGGGDGRLSAHLQVALEAACPPAGLCAIELRCSDDGSNALHASSPFRASVELLACEEALAKHQPDIVLCSWMPLGVDWTYSMRACAQAKEYILIGEADGGICGHPMLTWGVNSGGDSPDQAAQREHSSTDVASAPDQAQQPAKARVSTSASSNKIGEQLRGPGHQRNERIHRSCTDALLEGDDSCEEGCAAKRRRGAAADASTSAFKRVDLPELSALQLGRTDERWLSATKSRTVSFRRID